MNNCYICANPPGGNVVILENKSWSVSLSSNQTHLGRSFVTLKRHCEDLADLTKTEWEDFQKIVKPLEDAVRKTLRAKMFNWACLMNASYRELPYGPHVHWHIVPRYDKPVEMFGQTFIDPEFGHEFARDEERMVTVPENIQIEIVKKIKENLV